MAALELQPLGAPELRILAALLSPDYLREAAYEHGAGHAVAGARAAFEEASAVARRLARESSDAPFVEDLLALYGAFEEVEPEPLARELLLAAAPMPMVGWTPPIRVGDEKPEGIRLAALRALGEAFAGDAELGRAILPARGPRPAVYRRYGHQVMLAVQMGDEDVWPLLLDPLQPSQEALRTEIKRSLRRALSLRRHRLGPLVRRLLAAWSETGLLASYAAAVVSDATGLAGLGRSLPSLLPGTGIPVSILVPAPREGRAHVGIVMDHRAFDGEHGERLHAGLSFHLPRFLSGGEGWSSGASS